MKHLRPNAQLLYGLSSAVIASGPFPEFSYGKHLVTKNGISRRCSRRAVLHPLSISWLAPRCRRDFDRSGSWQGGRSRIHLQLQWNRVVDLGTVAISQGTRRVGRRGWTGVRSSAGTGRERCRGIPERHALGWTGRTPPGSRDPRNRDGGDSATSARAFAGGLVKVVSVLQPDWEATWIN